jgi:molybdopterin molybdotransferase
LARNWQDKAFAPPYLSDLLPANLADPLDRRASYHLSMRAPQPPSTVLSFEDARRVVEEHARKVSPPGSEVVDLLQAYGRILAEPTIADRDMPPFPRSTRDGYAVRSADLSQIPATLDLIGEIKAGEAPEAIRQNIATGKTASIMTGAPVPTGADAVVMLEYTSRQGGRIAVAKKVNAGDNIVARGAEARQGSLLLDRGVRLNETAIALAASVGKSRLQVFKRPHIAVLATGDEIVPIDSAPGATQIRNSNSYSLAAQIQSAGGEPVVLPIAPDEPKALRRLIEEGCKTDLLLLSGGVSMGRYDLVEQVLSELGAEFFFTGALIQPGRPVVFGKSAIGAGDSAGTYFFGLPGNPVSTMVTFDLFAKPMLEALAGRTPRKLTFLHARLTRELGIKTGLRRFLPALISGEFENAEVESVQWHGSGDIAATAHANCYLVISPDRARITAGEWVPVLLRQSM